MKPRIAFVTGSRAEYGLLRPLIQIFAQDPKWTTQIAATASHLSQRFGYTINEIQSDFPQLVMPIDMKLANENALQISQSISRGIEGFAKFYESDKPDWVVVLGDRYELWSATIPAVIHHVPIIHIHGGETTLGAMDDRIRHSITQMADLHFCSHPDYAKRIVAMGINQDHVHVVGALGIDRLMTMNYLSREQLENELGPVFGAKTLLCTFHPVTTDPLQSEKEVQQLMMALRQYLGESNNRIILCRPNADLFRKSIDQEIDRLEKYFPSQVKSFTHLGDLRYLSIMKLADAVVGNSSSGILEAPFLNTAVINVGKRQEGRLASQHVLHANVESGDIIKAIHLALSQDFQSQLQNFPQIYGTGHTAEKIARTINAQTNFHDRGMNHELSI